MNYQPAEYWDECLLCEHYRSEHSTDGHCRCWIIETGTSRICTCEQFLTVGVPA